MISRKMNIRPPDNVKFPAERICMKEMCTVKNHIILFQAMSACAFFSLALAGASAQVYAPPTYAAPVYAAQSDQDLGFYFNANLGPSFTPNFESSRFGYPAAFSARPGFRLGAEPGFNFMSADHLTLGGEFETGVIYNDLNSITPAGSTASMRGQLYQVPILGNLVLTLHPDSFVAPYIGVGGGGDYSRAVIHNPGFFSSDTWNDEVNPAFQAMAGIRFRLNSLCDVGFGYKFLADFPNEGKYIGTHSAQAVFALRF
jgi:opacity protein-like surface antigen